MVGTAVFGIPVADSLSAAGFLDPTSASAHATNLLVNEFDQGDLQMLITVSSNDGVQSSAVRRVGTDIVRQLHNSPYVAQVTARINPRTVIHRHLSASACLRAPLSPPVMPATISVRHWDALLPGTLRPLVRDAHARGDLRADSDTPATDMI